jgi:long-chain acyl-CoA synthetase
MELLTPLSRFLHYAETVGDEIFMRQPVNSAWKEWTWKQSREEVLKIAHFFRQLHLPDQSNIAILSKNCAHWLMADLAIEAAGHISVPLYASQGAGTIEQILTHAEAKVIVIGKLDDFEHQKVGIPSDVRRLSVSLYGISAGDSWEHIVSKYLPLPEPAAPHADDLCTIVYTSGTTGIPKGVMLTYGAIDFATANAVADLQIPEHPRVFSYLPLSHIAERIGIEMVGLYRGAMFSFAESIETFPLNLENTQPTLFFGVPRIWSKFKEKILEKLSQKKLKWILRTPILSGVVKRSVRKKLGLAHATHIFTGAAPINPELLTWFGKLGIEILQAYAMTENCCYGHFNLAGFNKRGTVGRPLSEIEVKLSPEGEVLLKHKALMKGYFKEPVLTAQVFEDGFLKTGDVGSIDSEGFLTLTGRLKEQFKTDKGKLIAPTPIETALLDSIDIEQVCVVGVGLPQPIALITISDSARARSRDSVSNSLMTTLRSVNATLERFQHIEKLVVFPRPWTIESGLLTPSLKVRRHELEKRHASEYLLWYSNPDIVIWE